MKILFIKNEASQIENETSLFLSELLIRNNIEVITFTLKKQFFIGSIRSVFTIRKLVKLNNIQLIHCFNSNAGKIAFLGFHRKKIVLSFFEKEFGKVFKLNLFRNISNFTKKYFTQYLFDKVILDSQKSLDFLGENGNYYFLPETVDKDEYYPSDRSFNKENMNLNLSETHILYLADSDLDFDNYILVSNAIFNLENYKIRLITFKYESSVIKNQRFNSADIIITSFNSQTIKQITEEILLTNSKLISLENNDLLEKYSHIENLHFCSKSSFEISEKIKYLLVTANQTSRDEILLINHDLILAKLLSIYEID